MTLEEIIKKAEQIYPEFEGQLIKPISVAFVSDEDLIDYPPTDEREIGCNCSIKWAGNKFTWCHSIEELEFIRTIGKWQEWQNNERLSSSRYSHSEDCN